jgi:hypothetical protein
MEEQILRFASVDESKTLVRQSFDRAFCHILTNSSKKSVRNALNTKGVSSCQPRRLILAVNERGNNEKNRRWLRFSQSIANK